MKERFYAEHPSDRDLAMQVSELSHPHRRKAIETVLGAGCCAFGAMSSFGDSRFDDVLGGNALKMGLRIAGAGVGVLIGTTGIHDIASLRARLGKQEQILIEDIQYLRERAAGEPIEELLKRAALLPSGGAKVIPPTSHQEHHERLLPALLHETVTKQVVTATRSVTKDAPDDPITFQLTTAGRHKDPFKRAAMNMLLAHPYGESWGTPFFKAEWGELAPLIHDGGAQNTVINTNWKYAHGRTDVLFRLPADACKPEHQEPFEAYIASRARFFQRASFAAHCHHEVTQGAEHQTVFLVPREVKEAGALAWDDYAKLSDRVLFGEYNLQGMLGSEEENRWFLPTDNGMRLNGYGPRFEANGFNSFFHLMAIEETKQTNGREVLQRAAACMDFLSDSVDDMLGLPISSRDSRFCISE